MPKSRKERQAQHTLPGHLPKLSVAECRSEFGSYLGQVEYQDKIFIIEKHGVPCAALVPLSVLTMLFAPEKTDSPQSETPSEGYSNGRND